MINDEQIRLLQNIAAQLEKDPGSGFRFPGEDTARAIRAALAEIQTARDRDSKQRDS